MVLGDNSNKKNSITKDYTYKKISLNIREFKHKYSDEVFYVAQKYKRSKRCNTLLEAQKYVDKVCIELKKPQVYNSFTLL